MGILLRGAAALDGLLERMWIYILYPSPRQSPPAPTRVFQDPSGKFFRSKLSEWADDGRYDAFNLRVEDVDYHVMYVPLRSTWYSVAYFYNRFKLPALAGFVRGKKNEEEMIDFVTAEKRRKKMETLLTELRAKQRLNERKKRS